jgi:exosortase
MRGAVHTSHRKKPEEHEPGLRRQVLAWLLLDHEPDKQPRFDWLTLVWFGFLLTALFFPVIRVMVKEWIDDESMGHGFFVIPVAGYIIWQRRDEVLSTPLEGHWTGWVLILGAFFQLIAGFLGADFFVMRMALLSSLLGLIVALCGWKMVRVLAFPLFLLLFMIRIPLFIYSQITFPLQLLASSVASETLNFIGIPVYQDGNILELPNQRLSVVEACSGIRSLLSLSFLALVYGYFFDHRPWMKWVLLIAGVPIAIMANATRVTLTGLISSWRPDLAEGVFHSLEGWVIFMVALAALLATHTLISKFLALLTRWRQARA